MELTEPLSIAVQAAAQRVLFITPPDPLLLALHVRQIAAGHGIGLRLKATRLRRRKGETGPA